MVEYNKQTESESTPSAATTTPLKSITKLAPITTITTTTATCITTTVSTSSSASTSPISPTLSSPTTSHTSVKQPISPILEDSVDSLTFIDQSDSITVAEMDSSSIDSTSVSEPSITTALHKKDSGTSMASSVITNNNQTEERDSNGGSHSNIHDNESNSNSSSIPSAALKQQHQQHQQPLQPDPSVTPTGRVLTRPLSTSKLSSTAMAAPHILPNLRHTAGFNLATLGQLSPSASTSAATGTMTMSRADTLAFLNSNSNNSYFTVGGSSSRASHHGGDINGIFAATAGGGVYNADGIVLPSGNRTGCGDAMSLLDLEDTHNDIIMIDSNGNSSGNGVTGSAVVGETMASASAFVASSSNSSGNNRRSSIGQSGSGGGVPSSALSIGGPVNVNGTNANTSSISSSVSGSTSSNPTARSSLPSLTSQAKRDAMQRAAMIAAMQQNGGAKILAGRVGRRQDRPSRNIRFGEFHRICEIEYGFEQGKPLIANGRTLVHATRVLRLDDEEKREEMIYLFSDVLVTGTKIKSKSQPKEGQCPTFEASEIDEKIIEEIRQETLDLKAVNNPYAGHLENQYISRLTQVQSDIVEDDDRPLLVITAPQLSSTLLFDSITSRDNFVTLLNETILSHKHHLLSQSKYLADLKKFKRHSAFSFDTSFLKTWGIPGGLNLGSIKPNSGHNSPHVASVYGNNNNGSNINGTMGPGGTLTSSPLASPGIGGVFDPHQYQQYLNRPQSMAGSLFSFALNGGAFSSFSDHSKENSYATLRGTNAMNALQYHHQQSQMLHNRYSMASTSSGRPGIDRTSTGSTFDAFWFMKSGDNGRSRRSAMEALSVTSNDDYSKEKSAGEDDSAENPPADGSAASSIHSSSSGTNLAALAAGGDVKQATSSAAPPSHSSSSSVGTLRNGAEWVRDEDASVCMVCSVTKFGVLVRKHHCRLCGRVICWKCCQMKDVVLVPGTLRANVPHEFRKPIRACLDCVDQDSADENDIQPQQQQQQNRTSFPSSSPLSGVFGRLTSSSGAGPQLVTSATAMGSTFTMPQQYDHAQMPFHPRGVSYNRSGHAYPHHHRASMYRIDVERVGEEDEGEEEEEEQEEQEEGEEEEESDQDNSGQGNDQALDNSNISAPESLTSEDFIVKSNHGTLRLKDLDPADINEEEVQNQIMKLESEVESLLIQNAPLMFGGSIEGSSRSRGVGGGSSAAGKTRVLRGIPKEFMQAGVGLPVEDEIEEDQDENGEEKTMEELLAEQDEQMKRILTR
ncbi:hypothetical protein BGZ76_009575 [Entomortierella beljakovae]|nr:hypothetical protein BGZ76_009575 [Entomortierella beljakovae]